MKRLQRGLTVSDCLIALGIAALIVGGAVLLTLKITAAL